MKDFIKEFACAKNCDGLLYYDHMRQYYVCISYGVIEMPPFMELIKSFKQQ